ncbi:MAG: hypothetical protein PHW96_00800 [Candidatus Nanoarchaeia archaeon]|nr:hypothetical protein [Candidatus Nanoarchaeia archaeon]
MSSEDIFRNMDVSTLQESYTKLLLEDKYKEIKKLETLTGNKMSEQAVLNAYNELFKKTYSFEQVFRIARFTKQYLPTGDLETNVIECITNELSFFGNTKSAKKYMKLLGKKIELPLEEIAEKSYSRMRRRDGVDIKKLREIRKFTGMEPDEKIVEEIFYDTLENDRTFSFKKNGGKQINAQNFEKLRKFFGRNPSEETIQKAYDAHLSYIWGLSGISLEGRLRNISDMKKLTRQKPKISENTIQKLYERIIFEDNYRFGDNKYECRPLGEGFYGYQNRISTLRHIKDVLEVNPSDELVSDYLHLQAYGSIERNGKSYYEAYLRPYNMIEFIEFAGVIPDAETSNAFFKRCIAEEKLDADFILLTFADFYQKTNIKPDNALLNSLYVQLIGAGKINEVKFFSKLFSK